ncbi:MAG: cytochrome c oxidase subunit II [Hyphomicrobiales bacterium]|nr:cytochrome c oxidase subunit II [Hyphomicrobiales bacterium]MBV9974092.1 cytochrome c oxidase subunit II [Hyphomicrobiales bacterium]
MVRTARAGARTALSSLAAALLASPASAEAIGQPHPWQLGLQPQVTEIGERINSLHDALLVIITLITVFVLAMILYTLFRFHESRNPVPSRTTHNTFLEIIWTIVPVMILVGIAIPSFSLLRFKLVPPPADIVMKATGSQWLWTYDYPKDQGGGFSIVSKMLDEKERADLIAKGTSPEDAPRLLAVDNEVVLPVDKIIKVEVTSADVIHGFNLPAFGVKVNAIPGRNNEVWFKVDKEGLYYGQCTQICGDQHSEMPLAFHIVSQDRYAEWLKEAKEKYASNSVSGARVADASPIAP